MKKSEIEDLLLFLENRTALLSGRVKSQEEKANDIQARVAILQEWRRKQEDELLPAKTMAKLANPQPALTADALLVLRDLRDRIRGAGGSSDKHQGALLDECLEVLDQIFGEQA